VINKNAARIAALVAVPATPKAAAPKEATGGWDPYEVWRTRVLLPRLEPRLTSAERPAPGKPVSKR
jgi:hypothetical protein